MKFYSQHGEDEWIYRHIEMPPTGFYVDVGAANPTDLSNTALWRDLGWGGLNIDANGEWSPMWQAKNLELIVATIGTGSPVTFDTDCHPYIGHITGPGDQPTTTLASLLAKYSVGKIDLLSVDLEGAEHDAVMSLDLELHQPGVVIVEFNTMGAIDDRLGDYFSSHPDYEFCLKTACNYVFKHARLTWKYL